MDKPTPSPPSTPDLEKMRQAVIDRFGGKTGVLGSQLGVLVRANLPSPTDLKAHHGGLKAFLGKHFADTVQWRDRRGLDDLYDVRATRDTESMDGWRPLRPEGPRELWAAVSNPSVSVQFALGEEGSTLCQAPAETPVPDSHVAVRKLDHQDYQEIASAFVESRADLAPSTKTRGLELAKSFLDFTRWIRELELVSDWEAHRVHSAIALFVKRLGMAGANASVQDQWKTAIERSQALSRHHREHTVERATPYYRPAPTRGLDAREVISKALVFMNDKDVQAIQLPVGAILRAIESIR